ncbi:MAG: response regulator [Patescibacteria group bacterium]|mgnify:FL=1
MKKRILIVEDNRDFIVILRSMLKRIGDFKIFVAHDGIEGEVTCEAHIPDLVIMDMLMPAMNGIEATRIMRRHFPKLPIIMLTASDTRKNEEDSIAAGCNAFLKKPISLAQLREAICKFIPCSSRTATLALLQ